MMPGSPGGVPLTLSEDVWQRKVMACARHYRWLVAHFKPARLPTGRWVTPMTGDVGVPDLILARDGQVILAELKRHGGKPTPGQKAWLEQLGVHGRLWTPAHWLDVHRELRDGVTA